MAAALLPNGFAELLGTLLLVLIGFLDPYLGANRSGLRAKPSFRYATNRELGSPFIPHSTLLSSTSSGLFSRWKT